MFTGTRFILRTEPLLQAGKVQQIGFVGTCRFQVLGAISKEDRRAIMALSRFASFAGVGMKTTMGMGQTLTSY